MSPPGFFYDSSERNPTRGNSAGSLPRTAEWQHPAGLADYQKKPASAVNQNAVGSPKKAIIPAHPSANATNSDASFHHSAKKMMHVCHWTDVAEQHNLTSTSINGILDFL